MSKRVCFMSSGLAAADRGQHRQAAGAIAQGLNSLGLQSEQVDVPAIPNFHRLAPSCFFVLSRETNKAI
jgi:hypothetical protein